MFFTAILKASFSFLLFSSLCFLSFSVAILLIGLSGDTILSSLVSLFGTATSAYSSPNAVSTITKSPIFNLYFPGSK